MAVQKLSQITAAGAPPAVTDQAVFVTSGAFDNLVTVTQLAAGLPVFTAALRGSVPASGGGTTNFLRADGSWQAPPSGAITINTTAISGGANGNFLYDNAATVGERTPTQATAALNVFTNTLQGLVPGSGGGTTNFLRADGTWAAAGGAPAAPSLSVQYNNAGAFGGMSGTSWDDTNRSLTMTGATVTVSHPVFDMTQTWNAGGVAFTGFKLNVTNTASAVASKVVDFQVGSASVFNVDVTTTAGGLQVNFGSSSLSANTNLFLRTGSVSYDWFLDNATGTIGFFDGGITTAALDKSTATSTLRVVSGFGIGWSSSAGSATTAADTIFFRDAAQIIAQRNSTNANTFRVYNTFTDSSNYERGVMDWTTTANTLTIGTQAAGTGTVRPIQIAAGGTNLIDFGITNANQLTVTTSLNIATTSSNSFFFASTGTGLIQFNQAFPIAWTNGTALTGTPDAGLSRTTAKVIQFGDGAKNSNGWMQWAGQARVTSDFNTGNSTTLANITGLTVTVAAGRTYSFVAELFTTSNVAAGVQFAIAGTCTATSIVYEALVDDAAAVKAQTRASALATAVGAVTAVTAAKCTITGTITVNAAGTLTVQIAQNVGNAAGTIALRGSYFLVYDMP